MIRKLQDNELRARSDSFGGSLSIGAVQKACYHLPSTAPAKTVTRSPVDQQGKNPTRTVGKLPAVVDPACEAD